MAADAPPAETPWLSRTGFAIALCVAFLYVVPYFPKIRSANELPRVFLTQAMVDGGTFQIDAYVTAQTFTADMSRAGGHVYSNKAPGSSMLAVPAYAVLRVFDDTPSVATLTWLFRLVTGILPTLLFLPLLSRSLAEWAPAPAIRRAVLIAYTVGSMAMTYSVLFIAHQLSAVCIGAAWLLLREVIAGRRDQRWMWAVGFLAGAAPLVDYQAAFAGVPLVLWSVWRLVRTRGPLGTVRLLLPAAIAALPPLLTLLAYHHACFGSPWKTGYDASETFAHYHQAGFLGLTEFRAEALWGSTFRPDNGLFTLAPWLLLMVPGFVLLARRRAWDVFVPTVAIVIIYLAFISAINFWRGGWQLGPRYITVMLPFALPAVAVALTAAAGRWWSRGAALGLIVVGVVVYAGSTAQFPHWPDRYANPLYEITFRLWAEGYAAPNLGQALGLRGTMSLMPYVAAIGVLVAAVVWPARGHARSAAVAIAVALTLLLAYGAFTRTPGADAERAFRAYVAGAMPAR